MTTDVYPRENCIAPAIVFIVWTTDTKQPLFTIPETVPAPCPRGPLEPFQGIITSGGHKEWTWTNPGLRPHSGYPPLEERGVAHRGGTGEMWVWAGTVA